MSFNRRFWQLLSVICLAELLIMFAFTFFHVHAGPSSYALDAGFLLLAVAPIIYAFTSSEDRLRKSKLQLEERVAERTAQLEQANARLADWARELEGFNSEFSMLLQLGDLLQNCRTLDEVYSVVERTMSTLYPTDSGALYLLDGPERLSAVAFWGEGCKDEKVLTAKECSALAEGRENVCIPGTGVPCAHIKRTGSHICVPVLAQGETIGMMHLRWEEGGAAYFPTIESRRRLGLSTAERIGLAVQNLKLRDSLKELSIKDPLTGLFNRRHMDLELERELERAQRKKAEVGLIMADLDYFKHFNDTFGHKAGDVLLNEVGMLLAKSIRAGDIACRYGGEEFLLILPDASFEDARQRAEEIRKSVKQMRVVYQGGLFGPVSLSLGVARIRITARRQKNSYLPRTQRCTTPRRADATGSASQRRKAGG